MRGSKQILWSQRFPKQSVWHCPFWRHHLLMGICTLLPLSNVSFHSTLFMTLAQYLVHQLHQWLLRAHLTCWVSFIPDGDSISLDFKFPFLIQEPCDGLNGISNIQATLRLSLDCCLADWSKMFSFFSGYSLPRCGDLWDVSYLLWITLHVPDKKSMHLLIMLISFSLWNSMILVEIVMSFSPY